MEHKTYKAFCSNDECEYMMNRSWAFKPRFIEDEICPRCQSTFDVREVEDEGSPLSPALVSGVGQINHRVGDDFRDLLQAIKKNTPRNNMKDYK